ncbi:MAG: VWA domain-containing protein [Acidobacteriota bacterium]|nr:VWA domain-containing protein [Acidobacteriota bacterium]
MVATAVILTIIVPVTGLAIDVTMLYVDKTRLQGAVDGAALAGAKGLSRGNDDATQIANAKQDAAQYVFLNYPASFFFTNSITVNQATDVVIDETVANQRTVSVTAHAVVPTIFMRWLNFTTTNVNASSTVTRRDVNVAIVVDRSGSLAASGSCGAVKQAAVNFVSKFANGTDNIALVTFASTTSLDFAIANNFQTAGTNVPTLINNVVCQGSTSSAMALWYGYDQLVGLNQPAALNVILLFTDGKPTGVNVNMPVVASSMCGHPGAPRYINGLYNTYTNVDQFFGLLQPTPTANTIANADLWYTSDASNSANCIFASGWPSNVTNTSDFLGVPLTDVYGSNLDNGFQPITRNGSNYIDFNNSANAGNMPQNALDDAATKIRSGAVEQGPLPNSGRSLSNVIIYTVGLGNAPYPLSVPLLERVSNDTRSSIYSTSQATGLFVLAPTTADINASFARIASEILRIAK